MKKKALITLFLALVCVTCLCFTACEQHSMSAEETMALFIFEKDGQVVSSDFVLPNTISDYAATWESDKTNVTLEKRADDYLAKVTLPESGNVTVKLTATINGVSKEFSVRVRAIDVYDIMDSYTFTNKGESVYKDFDLDTSVSYKGKTATIVWTAIVDDADAGHFKISEDGSKCLVTPADAGKTINVCLKATFTYGNESAESTYKLVVADGPSVKDLFLKEVVSAPIVDTAYKLALYQKTAGKVYYCTGAMSGDYLATTDNVSKAADVKIEKADGGYYLKLADKYITLTESGGKAKISLTDTATTVFEIGTNNILIGTSNDKKFVIGTYSTYTTGSASSTSYYSDASVVDVSQYPFRLVSNVDINGQVTPAPTPEDPSPAGEIIAPADAKADTAYKLAVVKSDKTLYFTGVMSGYYIATTQTASEATDVYVKAVEGGYKLYFKKGDADVYISAKVSSDGEHANIGFSSDDFPETVWAWDATKKCFTVKLTVKDVESVYYMGSSGTFTTISISDSSKYTPGEGTNYVATLATGAVGNTSSETKGEVIAPADAKADTAYKFAVIKSDKTLYFTGVMSGYYIATSETASEGTDVYVKAVEGGYKLYFKKGDADVYISAKVSSDGAHANIGFSSDEGFSETVWTWDATAKCFKVSLTLTEGDGAGTADYYIGSSGTFKTFSLSNSTKYAPGEDTNYVAVLTTGAVSNSSSSGEDTSADVGSDKLPTLPAAAAKIDLTQNHLQGDKNSKTVTLDGITVTNDKGSSTTNVAIQDAYADRFYKSSTLTISYTSKMTAIKIVCDNYVAPSGDVYYKGLDGLTIAGATIYRNGADIVIVFTTPVETCKIDKLASQLRVNSIEVYTGEVTVA